MRRLIILGLFGAIIDKTAEDILHTTLPGCDRTLITKYYPEYVKGAIDAETFWDLCGDRSVGAYEEVLKAALPLNEDLAYIYGELKDRFDLLALGNAPAGWRELFAQVYGPYLTDISLSGATGHTLPDPNAYLHVIDATGYSAHECFAVDSKKINLAVAADCGMKTFWVRDTGQDSPYQPVHVLDSLRDLPRLI